MKVTGEDTGSNEVNHELRAQKMHWIDKMLPYLRFFNINGVKISQRR